MLFASIFFRRNRDKNYLKILTHVTLGASDHWLGTRIGAFLVAAHDCMASKSA